MKYAIIAALLATAVDAKYGKCTPGVEGKIFMNNKCEGAPVKVVHMSEDDAENTGICIDHLPQQEFATEEEADAATNSLVIECDKHEGIRMTLYDDPGCDSEVEF